MIDDGTSQKLKIGHPDWTTPSADSSTPSTHPSHQPIPTPTPTHSKQPLGGARSTAPPAAIHPAWPPPPRTPRPSSSRAVTTPGPCHAAPGPRHRRGRGVRVLRALVAGGARRRSNVIVNVGAVWTPLGPVGALSPTPSNPGGRRRRRRPRPCAARGWAGASWRSAKGALLVTLVLCSRACAGRGLYGGNGARARMVPAGGGVPALLRAAPTQPR